MMSAELEIAAKKRYDSHLGKAGGYKPIQEPAKEFVAYEYGDVQVSECHGASPFLGVREMARRSEGNSSRIQGDHKRKKLPK